MKSLCSILVLMSLPLLQSQSLDPATAEKFAKLALQCVHREYPNKIAHVMNSDQDARPPRELTPAFYGCFDWHSSVHGHWMLARVARTFPKQQFAQQAMAALAKSLTQENLKREAVYVGASDRASFERPYGLAWLLQLTAELRPWDDPQARQWAANLAPLEIAVVKRIENWIAKLPRPVRSGEHSNTAFALGLMLDYARDAKNESFRKLLEKRSRDFYLADRACPFNYEPSGEDFLSPCLAEADVMRRVLAPPEFATWAKAFFPANFTLAPAVSPDPTDGKLAHLDGLNLSRAWMMKSIAASLPRTSALSSALATGSSAHALDGLKAVTGQHYEGGHWLGSFAVYLLR